MPVCVANAEETSFVPIPRGDCGTEVAPVPQTDEEIAATIPSVPTESAVDFERIPF